MSIKLVELLLVVMLIVVLMILTALMKLIVHFVENPKFWSGFSPTSHFLGVDLVQSTDKRSIFGLDTTPNR